MFSRLPIRLSTNRLQALSPHLSRNISAMKEAIVSRGPKVKIIDSPIPKPGPGQIVTKIEFAASNPKDW